MKSYTIRVNRGRVRNNSSIRQYSSVGQVSLKSESPYIVLKLKLTSLQGADRKVGELKQLYEMIFAFLHKNYDLVDNTIPLTVSNLKYGYRRKGVLRKEGDDKV